MSRRVRGAAWNSLFLVLVLGVAAAPGAAQELPLWARGREIPTDISFWLQSDLRKLQSEEALERGSVRLESLKPLWEKEELGIRG